MRDIAGKVVAITGAASGIGRALAMEFASRGAHLALSDIDEPGRAETRLAVEGSTVAGSTVEVSSAVVDVADRAAVGAWADGVGECAVERNRRRVLIGPDAKVFDVVSRLPAGLYQRVLIADGRRRAS